MNPVHTGVKASSIRLSWQLPGWNQPSHSPTSQACCGRTPGWLDEGPAEGEPQEDHAHGPGAALALTEDRRPAAHPEGELSINRTVQ